VWRHAAERDTFDADLARYARLRSRSRDFLGGNEERAQPRSGTRRHLEERESVEKAGCSDGAAVCEPHPQIQDASVERVLPELAKSRWWRLTASAVAARQR
jgi:hypothetical protein